MAVLSQRQTHRIFGRVVFQYRHCLTIKEMNMATFNETIVCHLEETIEGIQGVRDLIVN